MIFHLKRCLFKSSDLVDIIKNTCMKLSNINLTKLFATINTIIIIKDILTSCFNKKGKYKIFLFLLVNFDAFRNFINVIRHVYFTQRLVKVGEGRGGGVGGRGRGIFFMQLSSKQAHPY